MKTTVTLRPDPVAGELRIEHHGQANPIHDRVVTKLCEELNATETHDPGTNSRLKYVPPEVIHFPRRSGCLRLRRNW